ncbi:MAG: hypothetical protein CK426_04255 [Legionella sp.]|nr:MAG: hypothetical protein CK423_03505 [Legionella sp.]PJD98900.1 MAG: hypothetical protein CK426_04255 [Legionella sp.]
MDHMNGEESMLLDISREELQVKIQQVKEKLITISATERNLNAWATASKLNNSEHELIKKNDAFFSYYNQFKRRIFEMTIASLGIGSGYIELTQSQFASVSAWIIKAVGALFAPASLPASVIESGIFYLDSIQRKNLLQKFNFLGNGFAETDEFADNLALNLVRARVHADLPLSIEHADLDAETFIQLVIDTESISQETPYEELIASILKRTPCLIPLTDSTKMNAASEKVEEHSIENQLNELKINLELTQDNLIKLGARVNLLENRQPSFFNMQAQVSNDMSDENNKSHILCCTLS